MVKHLLKHEMKDRNLEGFKVHVGLRPYKDPKVNVGLKPEKELKLVLKANDIAHKEWDWREHDPKNSGAVVDVVVIDGKRDYFKQSCTYEKLVIDENREHFEQKRKHKKIKFKKYWRLVNYPLEAFVVCIEAKIRVSGNMDRIKKDINELRKIKKTKKDCLVYLVVLDRNASIEKIKEIKKLCKNNVPLFKAIPSDQN